jgi:hypothetical protein
MRRLPGPAIWSIVLMVLPFVVLIVLLVLLAVGANPVTLAIASVAPTLLIGCWIVSVPVGIVAIVVTRRRWRLIGAAVITLAVLEPIVLLVVWVGSG